MLTLYFFTLIPLFIGAILWIKYREVVLWEWLGVTVASLAVVAIMHLIIYHQLVGDQVTLSGQISKTTFHPYWREEYWEEVCTTTGSGKNQTTECHEERRERDHSEYWDADTNIGTSRNIDQEFYDEIVRNFGFVKQAVDDRRSGLIAGDRNIYITENRTGYIYPITEHKDWDNPVKASQSLFKFQKPSEDIQKQLYQYPKNNHWLKSDRLLGSAKQDFSLLEFDRLNAILGPQKKVNLIIIGFGSNTTEDIAEYQKSFWGGGKENDLIITYGGPSNARWVNVFGWTEKDIVKSNLETLFLTNKIDNTLLPSIKDEVVKNYQLKDWSKFNYLSIDPPQWAYWLVFFIVMLFQAPAWYVVFNNDVDKGRYSKWNF